MIVLICLNFFLCSHSTTNFNNGSIWGRSIHIYK